MSDDLGPFPLEFVLDTERREIEHIRRLRKHGPDGKQQLHLHKGEERKRVKPPVIPTAGREATHADEPKWHKDEDNKNWVAAVKKAHAENFVGLAFSGGGIRSATFNLGVLQALADLKLLFRFDYLSTVSGGGYIGAWMAAWTKRLGSFAEVQERLATNRVHQEEDREPSPIRFLRLFSNYLTPKLGISSGDTWAMVGIYVRNLILNLTILLAMLAALLLVPRLVEGWVSNVQHHAGLGWRWLWTCAALLVLGFLGIANNMEFLEIRDQGAARQLTQQRWVLLLSGVPIFVTAALGGLWLVVRVCQGESKDHFGYLKAALIGAGAYAVIWLVTTLAALAYKSWLAEPMARLGAWLANLTGTTPPGATADSSTTFAPSSSRPGQHAFPFLGAVGAGGLAGLLYAFLSDKSSDWSVAGALCAGVPLVLGILLLAGTLHIGLMGTAFPDRQREWWGRLGGLLILWGLVWAGIFWVALRLPHFIGTDPAVKVWKDIAARYLTPAWILSTLGSIFAAKSSASGADETQSPTWMRAVIKVGPYAFIVGLLGWISWGIEKIEKAIEKAKVPNLFCSYLQRPIEAYRWDLRLLRIVAHHPLWSAFIVCVAVALFMSWRVDVNQFSMHMFYRNRLVRCYLGATNEHRSPNLFTGFDQEDDTPLKDLSPTAEKAPPYDGPYLVMNAALNLVKGKDLAWQERKAESFVMTPKFCGYDVWLEEQDSPLVRGERPSSQAEFKRREEQRERSALRSLLQRLCRYGYRRTETYAFPPPLHGLHLGLAMGISGAAASPNMGFYSSPPVGFLLTVFNVRLGQWLGNPRHERTWSRPTPALGIQYLANELLGGTNDEAAYVYLSDGGHFDNMGLYELVKRRCGLIVLCDAEADAEYKFAGLGNAIRKCRIDLGIDIDLDVSEITPEKKGDPSKSHCAIGAIHYERVDIDAPTGTIIYFKSSLTGNEPSDVKNYSKTCTDFPHESTAEQWFTESQFESYRKLGYHAVMSSILPSDPEGYTHGTTPPSTSEKAKHHLQELVDAGTTAIHEASKAVSRILPESVHKPQPEPLDAQLIAVLKSFGFDDSVIQDLRKTTS